MPRRIRSSAGRRSAVRVTLRVTLRASLVALAAVPLRPGALLGQPPAPSGPSVSVEDAVRAALTASPRVLAGAQRLAQQRGLRVAAGAPFDGVLSAAAGTERDNAVQVGATGGTAAAPTLGIISQSTDRTSYAVSYERQFRQGFSLSPQLSTAQAAVRGPASPTGTAAAGLRLTVPLLNNRGARVSRAGERAADAGVVGASHELQDAAAMAAYEAAVAYWNFLAAARRLDAQRVTESRAARLVEETKLLVQADARPAADTLQLLANLASKRAVRLSAEQAVVAAREALLISVGGTIVGRDGTVGIADVLAWVEPSTAFPATDSTSATSATTAVPRLTELALSRRPDLRGARAREAATRLDLTGATDALRPRLDLSVQAGYVGLAQSGGINGLVAPLHENVPGLNSSVRLSYQLPTTNVAARGRAAQLAAAGEQQHIVVLDVERRIVTGVAVAAGGLRNARLALAESEHALALSRQAVENERRKFQLGTATLFDVINAEEALTNALLGEIGARVGYANAVVALRLATGTLVDAGELAPVDGASVPMTLVPGALLTAP